MLFGRLAVESGASSIGEFASPKSPREEVVAFNTKSLKFHCQTCTWAVRCTRNCFDIPISEAKKKGVPCKVCGGSCRAAGALWAPALAPTSNGSRGDRARRASADVREL